MAADEIHVGDAGTVYTVVVKDGESVVDISTMTDLTIIFLPPDGEAKELEADFTTDGTDGSMYITSDEDTWDEPGEWGVQGYVVTMDGETIVNAWHTDIRRFVVYPNLD